MSNLLQRGFAQLLSLGGEGVQTLTVVSDSPPSPATFKAILQINPQVEIPSDIISDDREKALLEVTRETCPQIKQGNQVKDECNNVWTVINRDDNPATFTVKFWLVKNVPGKN